MWACGNCLSISFTVYVGLDMREPAYLFCGLILGMFYLASSKFYLIQTVDKQGKT
jgi:hypothetical protein